MRARGSKKIRSGHAVLQSLGQPGGVQVQPQWSQMCQIQKMFQAPLSQFPVQSDDRYTLRLKAIPSCASQQLDSNPTEMDRLQHC